MKREELKSIFDALRNDPAHHLGLGDIRLTIAQQDEILAMVSPLPPAEGAEEFLKSKGYAETIKHPTDGIIAPTFTWSHVIELLQEYVIMQKPQPTAGGAEEIIAKGKILMYGNIIVDPIMLPKGIYATKELRIYLQETTIEHLMEMGKMFRDQTQPQWLPDSYFDNLSKCELIDVDIVRDATLHAQRLAEKMVEEKAVGFADWLSKLQPSQKVSVWSKNGEHRGLFTMDNEQLYKKYLKSIEP